MESRLTMGLANTFTRVAPIEAKRPISAGPRTEPFTNTFSPERISFPIGLDKKIKGIFCTALKI